MNDIDVKVIQVIQTDHCRGRGTEDDVARRVRQYFDMEGRFLAESDPGPTGRLLNAEDILALEEAGARDEEIAGERLALTNALRKLRQMREALE